MVGERLAAFVAVLGVVALAGCASSGGDGEGTSSSSSTGPMVAPLQPRISWTVKEGNESVPGPGDALVFDASGSTGSIATYAWSFGDNATSANKVAEHAYAAAGLYNVTLTVAALDNRTASASVQVEVVSVAGQAVLRQDAFEGELPLMNPNSCTNQDVDCRDHVVLVLADGPNGTAAVAQRVVVNVTGTSDIPGAALQVFWRSPDGTNLAQTEASGLEHSLTYEANMAPGEYVVRVRLFTGAQVTYAGTAAVSYVTVDS